MGLLRRSASKHTGGKRAQRYDGKERRRRRRRRKEEQLVFVFFSVASKFAGAYFIRQSREENPGEINREEGDRCRCGSGQHWFERDCDEEDNARENNKNEGKGKEGVFSLRKRTQFDFLAQKRPLASERQEPTVEQNGEHSRRSYRRFKETRGNIKSRKSEVTLRRSRKSDRNRHEGSRTERAGESFGDSERVGRCRRGGAGNVVEVAEKRGREFREIRASDSEERKRGRGERERVV